MARDVFANPTDQGSPMVDPALAGNVRLTTGSDRSGGEQTLVWPACECPDDCGIDHENA